MWFKVDCEINTCVRQSIYIDRNTTTPTYSCPQTVGGSWRKLEETEFSIFPFSRCRSPVSSSAKSSHPKKTGSTAKATAASTSTSTPRSRASKDAGAAAQAEGKDAKNKQKSSTVPQKATVETLSPPGGSKSSPPSSDTKPLSSKASGSETEGAPSPSASAGGEENHKGLGPESAAQPPHVNTDTEDTSFTEAETETCSQGDKRERTGGEEEKKKGETDSSVENSPRWKYSQDMQARNTDFVLCMSFLHVKWIIHL